MNKKPKFYPFLMTSQCQAHYVERTWRTVIFVGILVTQILWNTLMTQLLLCKCLAKRYILYLLVKLSGLLMVGYLFLFNIMKTRVRYRPKKSYFKIHVKNIFCSRFSMIFDIFRFSNISFHVVLKVHAVMFTVCLYHLSV